MCYIPPESSADNTSNLTRSQIWADRAQVGATIIAAVAFIVTVIFTFENISLLRSGNQNAQLQTEDTEESTALSAIGSSNTGEQLTGLVLFQQAVINRVLSQPQTGESPSSVYNVYTTALELFDSYLSGSNSLAICPSTELTAACYGRGWGVPPSTNSFTLDAAKVLPNFLSPRIESGITALNAGPPPEIILSDGELARAQLASANFAWVQANVIGADLRGADLAESRWSNLSDLSHSYLQCANLQGADFRGADLTYADLRGANVQGADFRGAHITGAQVAPVYGIAEWPNSLSSITARPAADWDPATCLQNSRYWDNQPSGAGAGSGTGSGG
jgi:uncharacterized protein YjbI with pentapeptide repeats